MFSPSTLKIVPKLLFAVLAIACIVPAHAAPEDVVSKSALVEKLYTQLSLQISPEIQVSKSQDKLYFPDIWPASPLYDVTATLCEKDVFTCDGKKFQPDMLATKEAMLKMYYEMRYIDQGSAFIPKKYNYTPAVVWYAPYVYESIQEGFYTKDTALGVLTERDLDIFLMREKTFSFFQKETPYFDGLVIDKGSIHENTYSNEERVNTILSNYYMALGNQKLSASVRTALNERQDLFTALLKKLKESPLQADSAYSAEWKTKFREANVKEVLGFGEYKFKTNAAYRKKNIMAALNKMNGLVLQPGEEFNYWDILKEKGMDGIGGGWTLQGSREVWAWGGGLCGSATALFRSAWFSGLEITERRPHSVYTTGFYDMKDIGLDASIFLTSPNLKFRNNTDAPVMLYVDYKEEPGYGTAKITMLGTKPFEELSFADLKREGGYYIRERLFKMKDGSERTEQVKSSYRRIH
ncbi:MAG: VanW family protein [Candidatus Gracilibacteria bacterium]